MNYGKKGVRAKQKALNSKAVKWQRKILLSIVELCLIALIGIGICGVSAGIGIFKGILASTPNIRLGDVVASGQATVVYDCEGNEIDQYVSTNSNRLRVESMDELPDYLGKAFVGLAVSENRRSGNSGRKYDYPAASEKYNFHGLDLRGKQQNQENQAKIARAVPCSGNFQVLLQGSGSSGIHERY